MRNSCKLGGLKGLVLGGAVAMGLSGCTGGPRTDGEWASIGLQVVSPYARDPRAGYAMNAAGSQLGAWGAADRARSDVNVYAGGQPGYSAPQGTTGKVGLPANYPIGTTGKVGPPRVQFIEGTPSSYNLAKDNQIVFWSDFDINKGEEFHFY